MNFSLHPLMSHSLINPLMNFSLHPLMSFLLINPLMSIPLMSISLITLLIHHPPMSIFNPPMSPLKHQSSHVQRLPRGFHQSTFRVRDETPRRSSRHQLTCRHETRLLRFLRHWRNLAQGAAGQATHAAVHFPRFFGILRPKYPLFPRDSNRSNSDDRAVSSVDNGKSSSPLSPGSNEAGVSDDTRNRCRMTSRSSTRPTHDLTSPTNATPTNLLLVLLPVDHEGDAIPTMHRSFHPNASSRL